VHRLDGIVWDASFLPAGVFRGISFAEYGGVAFENRDDAQLIVSGDEIVHIELRRRDQQMPVYRCDINRHDMIGTPRLLWRESSGDSK
jgi:hypothetical protein